MTSQSNTQPTPEPVAEGLVMVDMVPPATARDRWMYEQGRLAERDARTHAIEAAPSPVALQGRDERDQIEAIARAHGTGGWQTLDDMVRFGLAVWQAARASLPASSDERDPGVLGYALQMAHALWEQHYKADAPNWQPCPDLIGVLTQIDNMVAGVVRSLPAGGVVGYMNPGHVHELRMGRANYGYVYQKAKVGASVPVYATPQPSETQGRRQMTDEAGEGRHGQ